MIEEIMKYCWGMILILVAHFSWAESIAQTFEQKFEGIHTMQARFNQTVYTKRDSVQSSGKMFLERPGKFHWNTTTPMEQLIIADGHRLWIYDEALEQVTVKKQAQASQSSAGLFLSDQIGSMLSHYQVSYQKKNRYEEYDLKSKSNQADFKQVIFQFEKDQLKGLVFYDNLGQRTVIQFEQIHMNTPISAAKFKFSPPKGVDVIDEGEAGD